MFKSENKVLSAPAVKLQLLNLHIPSVGVFTGIVSVFATPLPKARTEERGLEPTVNPTNCFLHLLLVDSDNQKHLVWLKQEHSYILDNLQLFLLLYIQAQQERKGL